MPNNKVMEETPEAVAQEVEKVWFEYRFLIADAVPALEKQVNETARQGYVCKDITLNDKKWVATMETQRVQYKQVKKEHSLEQAS